MIILVGGIKGGSGKSTIATNMAVMRAYQNKDVLLIDADSQASANDFTVVRRNHLESDAASYTAIQLQNTQVRTETQRMQSKYSDIIIDTGGRDSNSQRAGLTIADIMLIPFPPRSFDIWTVNAVQELVQEIKAINFNLKVYTFLNKADPKGMDNKEAEALLKEQENLEFIDTPIGNRKIFANATAQGLAVVEAKPKDQKAIKEINKLYDYVFKMT